MKKICCPLLAVLLLAGCATSTVQSRKHERPVAYQALSPELQAAADAGKVKVGMPMDAVYIAWGKPDQVTQSANQDGETTTWIYMGYYTEQSQFIGFRRIYTEYSTHNYMRAEADFVNGVVRKWRTLPAPGY